MLLWLAEKWDNPVFLREMRRRRLRRWLTAGGVVSLVLSVGGPLVTALALSRSGVWFALLPTWPVVCAAVPAATIAAALSFAGGDSDHEQLALHPATVVWGKLAAGMLPFLPAASVGSLVAGVVVCYLGGSLGWTARATGCALVWCAAFSVMTAFPARSATRQLRRSALALSLVPLALLLLLWVFSVVVLVQHAQMVSLQSIGVIVTPPPDPAARNWVSMTGAAACVLGTAVLWIIGSRSGAARKVSDLARRLLRREESSR